MDPHRRSASPDRRRPKELSFYKKSSSSSCSSRGPSGGNGGAGAVGSFSSRRDPLDRLDDRRRAGAASVSASAGVTGSGNAHGAGDNVPGRYGGSRGEYSRPTPGAGRSGRDDGRDQYGDRDRGGRSERYDNHPRQSYPTNRDREGASAPGEYKGGEPLRRVPTRDERDQAPSASASSAVYKGGDELRRVETRNEPAQGTRPVAAAASTAYGPMIEIIANDRLGRKVRVKCLPSDTVGDLKKLIAAQTGTIASKIQLKKWYTTYKDHITLGDYEINDGMSLEMY